MRIALALVVILLVTVTVTEAGKGKRRGKKNKGRKNKNKNKKSTCKSYSEDHTMNMYPGPSDTCTQNSLSSGLDKAAQDLIVKVHNELRNKVATGEEANGAQPNAADMRKLVWDKELATVAQRWTDQCTFGHDEQRNLCDGTYVGQNAYMASSSMVMDPYSSLADAEAAVRAWYSEVESPGFDSSSISPFAFDYGAGHYTQVVWAETDRVGCGLRYYKDDGWFTTLVVCNYAVGGNMQGAAMYNVGPPASSCPAGTSPDSTFPGLCAA